MENRTHSQEQHCAEHRQADGREHAGERGERTAAGRFADVPELDVAIFGRRFAVFGRVRGAVAEHP